MTSITSNIAREAGGSGDAATARFAAFGLSAPPVRAETSRRPAPRAVFGLRSEGIAAAGVPTFAENRPKPVARNLPTGEMRSKFAGEAVSAIPSWKEFELFIGPNAKAFQNVDWTFRAVWIRGRAKDRCWPGFFFPVVWFLYRKMYGYAAAVVIIPVAIALLAPGLHLKGIGFTLAAMGSLGKRLYLRHANSAIRDIRSSSANEEEALARIENAGGVSTSGAVVGVCLTLLLLGAAIFTRAPIK